VTPATERTLPVKGIDLHLAEAGPGGRPTASSPTSPAPAPWRPASTGTGPTTTPPDQLNRLLLTFLGIT
jgi:hypothetical protein